MSRVVVTGGSGKLGSAVVEELVTHGWDVVNVDLVPPAVPRCPFTRVELTDYGQTLEALTGIDSRYSGVDAVVHLAAIPGPGAAPNAATFDNNILSTYNVFAAARAAGIRNVVWASSETVLGLPFETPPPYAPVDEEYEGRPETSYSLSKHLGEKMAEQMCRQDPTLKIYGLRFSNVMRPEDYAAFPSFNDDPRLRSWNLWGYIDARDGAQARAQGLEHDGYGCRRLHHRERRHRDDDAIGAACSPRRSRACAVTKEPGHARDVAVDRQGAPGARLRAPALLAITSWAIAVSGPAALGRGGRPAPVTEGNSSGSAS